MDFDTVVQSRRSIRFYKKSVLSQGEVTKDVESILQFVGENSPSWKNSQTHRYFACIEKEKYEGVKACLLSKNPERAQNCDCLIVSCFEKDVAGFSEVNGEKIADNECGNEWGAYDLGLSDAILVLKACDLGYDTLIMGIRDGEKLRNTLQIPQNFSVMSVIALGKRSKDAIKPKRKALSEFAKIF